MKALILLLISLGASQASAKMFAFKCDWSSGDIIFAEEVQLGQSELHKTLDWDAATISLSLKEPSKPRPSGSVVIKENLKMIRETVTCVSVSQ